MQREKMEFDVLIIGAGPAGLSAAIRLKQLAQAHEKELTVCVIEKGVEVGAHILSGAVLEPRALNELIPDWIEKGAPLNTKASTDKFIYLTKKSAIPLPTPRPMHNQGNYIISLGNFCRWLAQQAEALGVNIFPGFAGAEILYNASNEVIGVATGDMGIDKKGQATDNFQRGIELIAKQTLFAEGCRGSLSEKVMQNFNLRQNANPQTYGIGIKELWEVDSPAYQAGLVMHTIGWPLDHHTYGGSFIYHYDDNRVAVGFVIGLDYENPWLNPFEEMQRFKTHPAIKPLFENGKRIEYGARALNEGGFQSIPKLTFPGGMLIGDSAGLLNVPKIKGTHTAMKSGMIAAECVFEHILKENLINPSAESVVFSKAGTEADSEMDSRFRRNDTTERNGTIESDSSERPTEQDKNFAERESSESRAGDVNEGLPLRTACEHNGVHLRQDPPHVSGSPLSAEPQQKQACSREITNYSEQLRNSWVWQELYQVRNIRPAFRWGLWPALTYAALDTYIFRGKAPWTFHHLKPDNKTLKPAASSPKINYPKPDGKITFDRLSSVYLSNTHHNENQPCHLKLKDDKIPITVNLKLYAAPEQRYCPAAVYEIISPENQTPYLQINAANCVHCKTCDIKDPNQNIVWEPPEGGGGPNYSGM